MELQDVTDFSADRLLLLHLIVDPATQENKTMTERVLRNLLVHKVIHLMSGISVRSFEGQRQPSRVVLKKIAFSAKFCKILWKVVVVRSFVCEFADSRFANLLKKDFNVVVFLTLFDNFSELQRATSNEFAVRHRFQQSDLRMFRHQSICAKRCLNTKSIEKFSVEVLLEKLSFSIFWPRYFSRYIQISGYQWLTGSH